MIQSSYFSANTSLLHLFAIVFLTMTGCDLRSRATHSSTKNVVQPVETPPAKAKKRGHYEEVDLPQDWFPTPLFEFKRPIVSPYLGGRDVSQMNVQELLLLAEESYEQKKYSDLVVYYYWANQNQPQELYALAKFHALAEQTEAAYYWLQQVAINHELDASRPDNDQDFITLRREPRWVQFLEWLKKCRAYHNGKAKPVTTVVVPMGYRVDQEGPLDVVVFLHGLGGDPLNFVNPAQRNTLAQDFADRCNIAIVAVSGTLRIDQFHYEWSDDLERDMNRVKAALEEVKPKVNFKPGNVILMGFSQGAQVAFGLAAKYPESFIGAIVLSPGALNNLLPDIGEPNELLKKRGFVFGCGQRENAKNLNMLEDEYKWAKAAGADVKKVLYPGQSSHSLPENFDRKFPEWIKFIKIATRG